MQNYDKEVEKLLEQVKGYLYARIAALAAEGIQDFVLMINLQPKSGAKDSSLPVSEDPKSLQVNQIGGIPYEIPQNDVKKSE